MTTLPIWAVYTVSLGAPLMAFLGVLIAQFVLRLGATELDRRSRREEGLRMFRWAAEHAAGPDPALVKLGTSTIEGLRDSAWFTKEETVFIDLFLDSTLRELRSAARDAQGKVVFVLEEE
jgi:hypothetical protein